ncbi:MAG: Flp family type IVb pilin [Chloroflexota bacterium]|nr:Flp family type IVb pilin [Chloroflexota bacterium]
MEKVQELYTRMMVELSYALEAKKGQGLVEYALIIALVSVALITALGLMTGALNGVFVRIQGTLDGAGL